MYFNQNNVQIGMLQLAFFASNGYFIYTQLALNFPKRTYDMTTVISVPQLGKPI